MQELIHFSEVLCLTKTYNAKDFEDWLHWYIDIIHFDHVVVYDNESIVDIKPLCEQYGDRVEYHTVIGHPDQYGIYMEHINNQSKSKWVIPLDDDEILYIGDKHDHDVNTFIRNMVKTHSDKDVYKLASVWANMLSYEPIASRSSSDKEIRTSLIDSHVYFSRLACLRAQNIFARRMEGWVKCFVRTDVEWSWYYNVYKGILYNKGHNPTDENRGHAYALFPDGKQTSSSCHLGHQISKDCFVAHYSLKSREEWIAKCKCPCVSSLSMRNLEGLLSFYDDVYKYRKVFEPLTCVSELFHAHNQSVE